MLSPPKSAYYIRTASVKQEKKGMRRQESLWYTVKQEKRWAYADAT
jgi:hypothetical protein